MLVSSLNLVQFPHCPHLIYSVLIGHKQNKETLGLMGALCQGCRLFIFSCLNTSFGRSSCISVVEAFM